MNNDCYGCVKGVNVHEQLHPEKRLDTTRLEPGFVPFQAMEWQNALWMFPNRIQTDCSR